MKTQVVKVRDLKISKNNVRQTDLKSKEGDPKLEASVKKEGLHQKIVCDSNYFVYIGGRRVKALRDAEIEEIEVEIRDAPDAVQLKASYSENSTKRDLQPFDRARFYIKYMKLKNINETQLAEELGESKQTINDYVRVYKTFHDVYSIDTIPYAVGHNDTGLTFDKALMILNQIHSEDPSFDTEADKKRHDRARRRLIKEIQEKGMASKELDNVITWSLGLESVVKSMDISPEGDVEKKAMKWIEDNAWRKGMRGRQSFYDFCEYMGQDPGNGKAMKSYPSKSWWSVIEKEGVIGIPRFANEQEAQNFFQERGGKLIGEETVTIYYGDVDSFKSHQTDVKEKEAKKLQKKKRKGREYRAEAKYVEVEEPKKKEIDTGYKEGESDNDREKRLLESMDKYLQDNNPDN